MLIYFIERREWKWILSGCVCITRGRQTNATVTHSWALHSRAPPLWIYDIWHRFYILERSPFDACTNTGAETTVSKCFDAISQQSVKQKTFVAFDTAHENSVNTKGRRDQSTGSESLCWCHYIPCVSVAESEISIRINWVEEERDEWSSDGSYGARGLRLVKGMILQRESMDCGGNLLKMFYWIHKKGQAVTDSLIKIKHKGRSH